MAAGVEQKPEKRGDEDEEIEPHLHEDDKILSQSRRGRAWLIGLLAPVGFLFFHASAGSMDGFRGFPSRDFSHSREPAADCQESRPIDVASRNMAQS